MPFRDVDDGGCILQLGWRPHLVLQLKAGPNMLYQNVWAMLKKPSLTFTLTLTLTLTPTSVLTLTLTLTLTPTLLLLLFLLLFLLLP